MFYWQSRLNQNALRFGALQIHSDIRQAQELAKGERYQYTVAFNAGAPNYTVQRERSWLQPERLAPLWSDD